MPVLGIDYEKCSGCGICLISCPIQGKFFKKDIEQDKIIFEDPENHCFRCGQCVAQCPEDAIVHIKMGKAFTFKNIENLKIKDFQENKLFRVIFDKYMYWNIV